MEWVPFLGQLSSIIWQRTKRVNNMKLILESLYITLAPVIFAGILNMVWVRLPLGQGLNVPMDNGRVLKDGRRLFGDHKTWKGFWGMIGIGAVTGILWGIFLKGRDMETLNLFYKGHANTMLWSGLTGALAGFAYALAELPNSFLKRRLDIRPGKNPTGVRKLFFIFLDQADSVIGCLILLRLVYPYDLEFFLVGVGFGAVTHILLNMLLYVLKLRKNLF